MDWPWDKATYAELLTQDGGKERLSMLASASGRTPSTEQIDAIHARKTEIACDEMKRAPAGLRPGVKAPVQAAKEKGMKKKSMKLALVTTTYRPNIEAILDPAGDDLWVDAFDNIVSRDAVKRGKPAPDCYHVAREALGVKAGHTLTVEDTPNSVKAAKRAGVQVIATPGTLTAGQDVWQADLVLDDLAQRRASSTRAPLRCWADPCASESWGRSVSRSIWSTSRRCRAMDPGS